MSIFNFRCRKLKSDDPPCLDRKGVSALHKRSYFLKKNEIQKQKFQLQKPEKYLKSKNDIKRLLGAFNQVL